MLFRSNDSNFYRYISILHQDFTNLYGLFYRGNKKKRQKHITRKILNLIDEYSLLIWYLDDGSYSDNGNGSYRISLHTNSFTLSEHKAIKIWFWQKWRIDSVINYIKGQDKYYLRFSVSNTRKLLNILTPYIDMIPECMHYKLKS